MLDLLLYKPTIHIKSFQLLNGPQGQATASVSMKFQGIWGPQGM